MHHRIVWIAIVLAVTTYRRRRAAQEPRHCPMTSSTFDIAPQALDTALLEFSEQADLQLVVAGNLVEGKETHGFCRGRDRRRAFWPHYLTTQVSRSRPWALRSQSRARHWKASVRNRETLKRYGTIRGNTFERQDTDSRRRGSAGRAG